MRSLGAHDCALERSLHLVLGVSPVLLEGYHQQDRKSISFEGLLDFSTMIDGITTLINGIISVTMISGIFVRKIVGGPVRDTSILEVVVVLHEVASVNLVEDRIDSSMRS